MDTKLKNNETSPKKNAFLLIFFLVYFICFSFAILYGSSKEELFDNYENVGYYDYPYEYNQNDYWRKSRYINEQGIRYVKNLNRFYIYYQGYEYLEGYEKIQEQDIIEELVYMQQYFSTTLLGYLQEFNPNIVSDRLLGRYTFDYGNEIENKRNSERAYNTSVAYTGNIEVIVQEPYLYEITDQYDYLDVVSAVRELQSDVFMSSEDLWEKIIAQKDENYNDIKNYLQTNNEFEYYLYTDTEVYTNVKRPIEITRNNMAIDETKLAQYALFYKNIQEIPDYFNGLPLNESFENNGIQGYFFIPSTVDVTSMVYEEIDNVNTAREINEKIEGSTKYFVVFSIVLTVTIFLYAVLIRRHDIYGTIKNVLQFLNKVPFFIKAAFFVIGLYISGSMLNEASHFKIVRRILWQMPAGYGNGYLTSDLFFYCISIGFIALCATYVFFLLLYFIKLFLHPRRIKNEVEIQFLWKLIQDIKLFASEGHAFVAFFMLALILVLSLAFLGLSAMVGTRIVFGHYRRLDYIFALSILFMLFIMMLVIIRNVLSNFKYSYYFDQMLSGNLIDIDPVGMNTKALDKLMNLNDYIREAVNERLKGEKLKSELITNVSHDLKTPLTTLINYIELLKNDDITRQEVQSYVSILEKKSQRLKYLVEDLFEISKLSNGQVKLQIDSVDVVALMKQTLGELAEKIEQSEINFRFTTSGESIYLYLDGNRIWRVFENLVNNIIKYSQKGTRAYIHIEDQPQEVQVIFKNISNYELNYASQEFFERFIRGDQARSTEGSGLGLTIAKSIIDLHKGKIEIETDGDLFKVMILFQKNWIDENEEE